jgi:tetratricopeptide (TPR) repeat protein
MDIGLLWTAVGSAAGVLAAGLVAWQIRLQLQDRGTSQDARAASDKSAHAGADGLPVVVPRGRLPVEVRGRDALLAELRHPLVHKPSRPGHTWVLAGMGGLGKSTVALAIAETARAKGWRVWWVTAADAASLTGGMLEILHQLGAPDSVTQPVREGTPIAAERAWEFLGGTHEAGRRWLLVFDNADTPTVLAPAGAASPADGTGWLRPDLPGMVVVTTRVKDPRIWGFWVKLRELRPLDEDTAGRVLADLAPNVPDPTREESRELGRRLGGLPLALHLAGSYLASPFARWHSFAGYQRALDSADLPNVLSDLDGVGAEGRVTIQQTWDLSLDALSAGGLAHARPILYLLSCYKPATPIPAALLQPELLVDLLGPYDEEPSAMVAKNNRGELGRRLRDSGLRGLVTVGLIEVTNLSQIEDWTVTVHPVVADALRSRLLTVGRPDLPLIGKTAVLLLQSVSERLDYRSATAWPTWRQLVAHMTALLEWLAPHLDESALTMLLSISEPATSALMRSGNTPAAEELVRNTARASSRLGGGHLANLTALNSMARVFVGQGRYVEAEQLYREVLVGRSRALGEDNAATLDTRQHLAWVSALRGRYEEAEQIYIEVLAGRRRVLGEDHPDTLDTRRNLADALWSQRRYGEAEQLYRQVLNDQLRILDEDHPDALSTRRNLAGAISGQGRYAEAEQLYRQVLDDQLRVLGNDHHRTLVTRHELGDVISQQGRHAEAEQWLRRVLTDRQRVLGDDHPATLATREVLTELLVQSDITS